MMKNIIKQLAFISVSMLLVVSCDWDENNFEALTGNSPDPDATYYVQFKNTENSFSTDFSPTGDIVEIETTIDIGILGLPLDEATTINFSIDGASTADADMYELGATSVVIPAGEVTASTTLTSVAENMPIDETVTLILNLDAGENAADTATQLILSLFRPAPCSWLAGDYTINMVDTYGDGWQTTSGNGGDGIQVTIDGSITEVGMCTPYEASPYDGCVEGPSEATAIVTIPEGAQSVKWNFPGDWWGEIGLSILDPNGVEVYKINAGEGVAGQMPFEVCTNK
ncbi:hypothetical protein [Maribacter polysaccharolyticus]|uniref:hypothetical protein n=1 Tax=Maribacter polysaccharolyticus TaxID=3020831 RepID=UPI00237F6D1B|nr:hypothetical protein [Maribacter polysaccharolyticus]MDE3741563.1 hypothetical protein [Maribacter polysaccharolyticus]